MFDNTADTASPHHDALPVPVPPVPVPSYRSRCHHPKLKLAPPTLTAEEKVAGMEKLNHKLDRQRAWQRGYRAGRSFARKQLLGFLARS
jgi:hypothetical protein